MSANLNNKRGAGGPTSPYTLNKFKPGKREHVLDDSVLDDATRRMLLEDIMRAKPQPKPPVSVSTSTEDPNRKAPSKPQMPSDSNPASGVYQSNTIGGSDDLLVIMSQRLKTLENNQRVMQLELKEKTRKVIELEDRLAAEKDVRQRATSEKASLQKELGELLQFLGDHGLTWEGSYPAAEKVETGADAKQKAPALSMLYEGNFKLPTGVVPQPPSVGRSTSPRASFSAPSNSGVAISANLNRELTPSKSGLPFDLELLKKNCLILSDHVGNQAFLGEGQRKILREREKVFVCVYSDGICVNSGPFRPYGWALCDAFLNDLLEGYYPYEYKDRYPDGYPIEVVDKSVEKCPTAPSKSAATAGAVPGAGRKLGGVGKEIHTLPEHLEKEGAYNPLTREEFLKRLPERYVAPGGRLVNVRANIDELVSGKKPTYAPVRSNVERLLQQAAENKIADEEIRLHRQQSTGADDGHMAVSAQGEIVGTGGTAPATVDFLTTIKGSTPASAELARRQSTQSTNHAGDESIVTLQIRLPQGQRCILSMFGSDSIADVRREFERAVPDFLTGRPERNAYELSSVFPRKVCTDHAATLASLGLAPTATLMLRLSSPDM